MECQLCTFYEVSNYIWYASILPWYASIAYFCLSYFCALGFFRHVLMCGEKNIHFPHCIGFLYVTPFSCLKDFGDGESSVYWGRTGTSVTACRKNSEGERWFWTLKCLELPYWVPLGTVLNIATWSLCFCLPFTQISQGSQGITRNSHFVPKGIQGHKNQAWSLFI